MFQETLNSIKIGFVELLAIVAQSFWLKKFRSKNLKNIQDEEKFLKNGKNFAKSSNSFFASCNLVEFHWLKLENIIFTSGTASRCFLKSSPYISKGDLSKGCSLVCKLVRYEFRN